MASNGEPFDLIKHAALFAASQTGLFPAPNVSLFRYVSLRNDNAWALLEKTVLEHVLPLTTSDSFNDPFDGNPIIVNDAAPDQIAALLSAVPIADGSGNRVSTDFNLVKVARPDGTILSNSEVEQYALDLVEKSYIARNKQARVASFCRRISSQLLWSHYADGYRGLAYHFRVSTDPQSSLRRVYPVRYEKQRPILLMSELLDMLHAQGTNAITQLHLSFSQRAYLTKSIEWAYEEELRLLGAERESTFQPNELASLIIGPKFPDAQLARLKEIISRRTTPLRIFKARTALTDYAIEIDWSTLL